MRGASAAAVIAAEWVLLAIGAGLILARLNLRLRINRQRLLISDIFICLAWCSAVSCSSFDIVFLRMGILHADVTSRLIGFEGDRETLQRALVHFWARGFPFFATLYLYKAAILGFYLQIIPEVFTAYRIALWATIVYTALGFVLSNLLTTLMCLPVERNWALDGPGCAVETRKLFHIAWGLHFSSSVIIFILPFYVFHNVTMRRIVKLAVYCLFGLGIIELSISLTRFVAIKLSMSAQAGHTPITNIMLWTAIDANLGVIIAILPSLRPYLHSNADGPSPKVVRDPSQRQTTMGGAFTKYGFRRSDLDKTTATESSSPRRQGKGRAEQEGSFGGCGATTSRQSEVLQYGDAGSEIELCQDICAKKV